MKNRIKLFILTVMILFTNVLESSAVQLPRDFKDYIISQKVTPTVRFDGILVYNNDVMYIPVIPSHPKIVKKIEIIKTYPENKSIESLPDMILFNNNYSLLKVIRIDDNTLTINNIPNLPTEVKTGVFPQDMMVPRGLVLPENLASIKGNIHIPMIGAAKSQSFISARKTAPLPNGKRVAEQPKSPLPFELKNKLFFVNNFQTEYLQVFSSSVSEPLYSLKTTGVMKDIKPALNGKYILTATTNKKNIDVIDVEKEYIVKTINLTAPPSEIAIDEYNQKAYVSSIKEEALFVIDLNTLSLKEKIQLVGAPHRLSISKDGKKIAYTDMQTSNVYILELENNYANKLITNYPNVTKLILEEDEIYLIARTEPKLRIVSYDLMQYNQVTKTKKDKKREKWQQEEDKKENVEYVTGDLYDNYNYSEIEIDEENTGNKRMYSSGIKDIVVGTKPIDMQKQDNKIFVLCAGDNSVYTYDVDKKEVVSNKLPVDGFSKSLTLVPNSNLAVITNMADLKYVVYDLKEDKPIQTQPINEYINMITILERKNGQ